MFKPRICPKCNKVYQPKGPTGFCKPCSSLHAKERRRERDKTDVAKARYARYRDTDKYREYARNRYHSMSENVRKARYYLHNAIRDGKLTRPEYCQKCGIKDWGEYRSMIEGNHYLGYDPIHWLDVEWLCTNCHKIADGFKEV